MPQFPDVVPHYFLLAENLGWEDDSVFTVDGKHLCVTLVAGSDTPELCHKGSGTGGKKGIFSFSLQSSQSAKWGFCFLFVWYGNKKLL